MNSNIQIKNSQLSNSVEDCEIFRAAPKLTKTSPRRIGSGLVLLAHTLMTVFCIKMSLEIDFDIDIPPKTSNTFSPQLPVLPSVQGSRRGSCSVSSDISEPLDFLIEGESRKKSETDISLDTSELVPEKTQEEVQTSLFVTCVRRLAKCRE